MVCSGPGFPRAGVGVVCSAGVVRRVGGYVVVDSVVGGCDGGGTPGPIPNPEAKPSSADGTAPARVWESRSPPTFNMRRPRRVVGGAFVIVVPDRGREHSV